MLHWAQATMYKALALLLETLVKNDPSPLKQAQFAAPAI
jgi:hypothetical protein